MTGETAAGTGRVLVVYYSLSGNTARVAADLAKRTQADLESLRDKAHGLGGLGYLKAMLDAVRRKPSNLGPVSHSPRNYTLVIIGTPVWAWHMTPAIHAYLRSHAAEFENVAFFVTSGDTDIGRILPSLEAVSGRSAVASAGFNAQELADPSAYEAKLSQFLLALNRAPGRQRAEPGSALQAR